MAFGRIKDLDATLATSSDAAIIASEPFFTYTPGYKISLCGKTGGSIGEKYHIIAASKEITAQNIGEKKVGIVDFLGKDRLPLFIKDQFGVDIKMLKRVNKEDDLLTMIGMEAVDAIIVSDSQFKEIKSNTKLPLAIVVSSSKAVGFASFGISHYPGVRSIGWAAVVGIALSCLASITLLPALLATGKFRHRKAAMLGEPESEE